MNKFTKIFAIFLILASGALLILEYKNLLPWHPKEVISHVITAEVSKKNDINNDINSNSVCVDQSTLNKSSTAFEQGDGISSCKSYFVAIDQMIINFFRRESFNDSIAHLKTSNPPPYIAQQLFKIEKFHNHEESNIIKNEIVSKVIRIEKLSVDQANIDEFLKRISRLQKYFYSPEFIDTCRP
jgi:hypothetical protein